MDVAGPPEVLIEIWEAIEAGTPNFCFESDGKIAFDAPQGFRVRMDIIQISSDSAIERIHATVPFHEGSVASMSDLVLFRAKTVVERGSDGEVDNLRWLLFGVAKNGDCLPELNQEELDNVRTAGETRLGVLDRLVLASVLGLNNGPAALALLESIV